MNLENKIKKLGGVEIIPTFEPLKDNSFDINRYLENNKLKLSEDYITFSILCGYSEFINDIVVKSVERISVGYEDGTIRVSFIYGWGKGEESLQNTRESLLDQIGRKYFVFAEGNPGDYFLINMLKGDIYYYSHDSLPINSLYLVAHNFEDFIDRLQINVNVTDDDDDDDYDSEEWFADDF
ncbi:SMI1/KNR4 family protein [Myroides odoratimimus]|uniref:SMI1/KNR4 family protein n=1 Tax=Myroides odoratimimus TaxID=76832 RepID=UPI003101545E